MEKSIPLKEKFNVPYSSWRNKWPCKATWVSAGVGQEAERRGWHRPQPLLVFLREKQGRAGQFRIDLFEEFQQSLGSKGCLLYCWLLWSTTYCRSLEQEKP